MSAIIEASDIACASETAALFGIMAPAATQIALVANLIADHRAKAVDELRAVLADVIETGRLKDWSTGANSDYRAALEKARALLQ